MSELLQIKRSTLGNWRSRDSVPYTICVSAAEERGVRLDWLLTGEGPMWRGADPQKAEATPTDPREQALLALWRELDEGEQREIQLAAEEKKRLKILEQRLAELEAVVADAKRLA
ncbi:helix-turn-helix domain-containing protein [Pseudomonas aeruginosa]|nr:helix-turn-helix domain-containing protein [Pseudomonas aeruginosa]